MNKIIIYDFDGTLTPHALPSIEILNFAILNTLFNKIKIKCSFLNEFFCRSYYRILFYSLVSSHKKLTDENLTANAKDVKLNIGVENFLQNTQNLGIKNYILSSDMRVFLEKTRIAPYFEDIIATTFKYNEHGEVIGIDYLVHDKEKINAIRGILIANGKKINDFRDVIFIGDGLTDMATFEFIKENGGHTILIQGNPENNLSSSVDKTFIDLVTEGDYRENSPLAKFIKRIYELDFNSNSLEYKNYCLKLSAF